MHNVTLIEGDGIGPDVINSAVRVIKATGIRIDWIPVLAGEEAVIKYGTPFPSRTVDAITKTHVALKGPLNTPMEESFRSINVALRKKFELFLNVRSAISFEGINSRFSNVDIILLRENTEEFYTGEGGYNLFGDRATLVSHVTRGGCERFFREVYKYALKNNRRKVAIFHKANILKPLHTLFLEVGRKFARANPEIITEEYIADAGGMRLVMDPNRFDIIATTNLFGDLFSDICAGLVGGLGVAPGANIGDEYAIFEAVHGSAPDIAGKNIANPTSVILSAAMMLDHIGEPNAASLIRKAVVSVIRRGKFVTKDINPNGVGTTEMTDAIIHEVLSIGWKA